MNTIDRHDIEGDEDDIVLNGWWLIGLVLLALLCGYGAVALIRDVVGLIRWLAS